MYSDSDKIVLSVKPGITDYASIFFRNEVTLLENATDHEKYYIECIMPEKLTLNKKYILEHNFLLDLKIIFKTLIDIFK